MLALTIALALAQAPDELSAMLAEGPIVRVLPKDAAGATPNGEIVGIADVGVSATVLWSVLVDYPRYRSFMPLAKEVVVETGKDGATLVKWTLDTPFISTKNTNRMSADESKLLLRARTVAGANLGSEYEYRVIPLSENRCRLVHTARHRNFASFVTAVDDKEQTVSTAVSMVAVIGTVKALKQRAEALAGRHRP